MQAPFYKKKFDDEHEVQVVAFLQVEQLAGQFLHNPSTLLKYSVDRQGVHQPVELVVP